MEVTTSCSEDVEAAAWDFLVLRIDLAVRAVAVRQVQRKDFQVDLVVLEVAVHRVLEADGMVVVAAGLWVP